MKKKWMSVLTIMVMGTLLFTACKKQEEVAPKSKGEQADDASARNELDRAQSDIESVYNSDQYAGNQRGSAVVLPCGSVTLNTNNYTINYNGVNCGSRVLSGSIAVTLVSGTKFSDANAKLQIVFNNYKVHYNASGEEIVYNGTTYITNSTGGTLASLFTTTPGTVIHKTRGTLTLTYDTTGTGGSTFSRTWNLFRKKTFSSDGTPTGISLKFEGDTTIATDTYLPGTYDAVSEYGTDVDNRKFIHTIPTPFVWSNCGTTYRGPYTLKTGRVEHTAFSALNDYKFQFTATAGYRNDGANNILVQSCSSNGYLLNITATVVATSTKFVDYTSFQQY
jgi:hypothetical protein